MSLPTHIEAVKRISSISVREFETLFRAGKLVFFAGSGISLKSGLPSVEAVLDMTLRVTLPLVDYVDRKKLRKMQAEVFYETMIEFTDKNKALQIWKALHPDMFRELKLSPPEPNIVHTALVEYSAMHALPVFTTNFDTLFEDAAEKRKLNHKVLMPTAAPLKKWPQGVASICKLHGSIADKYGSPNIDSLFTTMTDITRVNTPWVDTLVE